MNYGYYEIIFYMYIVNVLGYIIFMFSFKCSLLNVVISILVVLLKEKVKYNMY